MSTARQLSSLAHADRFARQASARALRSVRHSCGGEVGGECLTQMEHFPQTYGVVMDGGTHDPTIRDPMRDRWGTPAGGTLPPFLRRRRR